LARIVGRPAPVELLAAWHFHQFSLRLASVLIRAVAVSVARLIGLECTGSYLVIGKDTCWKVLNGFCR